LKNLPRYLRKLRDNEHEIPNEAKLSLTKQRKDSKCRKLYF
jgi:hypothetical protein